MSEHTEKESKDMDQDTSNWPGGWFVYQDGRVDGPFEAKDAFALEHVSSDGKSRLVSRKGC